MGENTKEPQRERTGPGGKRWDKIAENVALYVIECIFLAASVAFLLVVIRTTDSVKKVKIDSEDIRINKEVTRQKEEGERPTGYRNIALFGVDARDGKLDKGTRSDTIIICSINQDTREITLISVYRDTYLNLCDGSYNKCNAAYAKGGANQALNMLNTNLDLDITDYVTVGFAGLIDAIDALGGIEMEIKEEEISHLNNYQLCMAEELNTDYIPVREPGRQLLNGMQATAYCRVRFTKGNDFKRTERQRNVLIAMMEKAKSVSPLQLTVVVNAILPQIATSLDINEVLSVLSSVAEYNVVTSEGFPYSENRANCKMGSKGDCIIPMTLEDNVRKLHDMMYGGKEYEPSREMMNCSSDIREQAAKYMNS